MPKECLPPHLQDKKHNDWWWPWSEISRGATAKCGDGPVWHEADGYESKPIPRPGLKSAHNRDKNGEKRWYQAIIFNFWPLEGFHIRIGDRWDDGEQPWVGPDGKTKVGYYNWVILSFGFEYKDGEPI